MEAFDFAIGSMASVDEVPAGKGVLAAGAAECVGVDISLTPSSTISPSTILWSGSLVEFACLRLSFLDEPEGVDFRLFLLKERGIDVL
jgi:hypothetical protein